MSSSRLTVSWGRGSMASIAPYSASILPSASTIHLFGIGRHKVGVGGRDLGFGGLRRGNVCRVGTDGCSNSLGDCQLFGRGLPTVVREASFDLCGDLHELGMDGLDMVVGGLHQG